MRQPKQPNTLYQAFLEDGSFTMCLMEDTEDTDNCLIGTYSFSAGEFLIKVEHDTRPSSSGSVPNLSFLEVETDPVVFFTIEKTWLCSEADGETNCWKRILPQDFPCDCPTEDTPAP